MALFFGGNPFATSVGKKIEQATDASLPTENWALNMEICDIINETEDGPNDAIKAIKKRLSQNPARNFTTTMYTLTVLESCVKNCKLKFLILVCNKDFIQEMVKVIGPKNDPPVAVQQKVLGLIQAWADAFKNEPELNGVCQVYNELKQKGIEFPLTDLDTTAPIYTPQRSLREERRPVNSVQNPNPQGSTSPGALSIEQRSKLTTELRIVEGNMAVLSEMLGELVPGKEPPSDLELMKELYTTCQAMQERLVELISQLSNDDITAELLRVNDGLNNLFLRYSRYEKNRKSISKDDSSSEEALIDFNVKETPDLSSVSSRVSNLSLGDTNATSQLNSIPTVTAKNQKDEFDIFARSRKVTGDSTVTGGPSGDGPDVSVSGDATVTNAQVRQPINGSPSVLPVPDLIGMHMEQDFDEMAAWLGEKQEESLTSSEFEKFLAERAAAAEALPSSPDNQNASNSGSSKKPNKDSMFAQ